MTMRTQVAATSVAVYHAIKRDGTVSVRQAQILAAVKPGRDYSLQELVKLTGLPVNVVSGRCFELKDSGVLVLADKRTCTVTGRLVAPVKLPSAQGLLL
jgi:hypothetical protein